MKTISYLEADLLAAQFRSKLGLGLTEPICIKSLLMKLGVTAVFRPLSESSYGIGCKSSGNKMFILVNSNTTIGRQNFTIAHELYHFFFDEHPAPHMCSQYCNSITERNANRFASSLLMPREGILSMVCKEEVESRKVSLATVLRLENYFEVSRSALLFRLKDIELIDSKRKEELRKLPIKESAKDYGYDLSVYEKGNEGLTLGDFGEKARILFERGTISEGHYVELMNMISYDRSKK
ncbi:MAG: ImmA/IrrE family metallo-endopeptidase [Bacteroidales bacterium]|nr:ImmA/IrrE family metallo-endopeptidase [Bacteroidales bacterium]